MAKLDALPKSSWLVSFLPFMVKFEVATYKRKIHGLPWFTHIHLEKNTIMCSITGFMGIPTMAYYRRVTVWPQRREKKNILIRIVSIDGCLNQLLHPMIFPFYPHCIRTFGWLNHVKAIFGDPDTPPRRSKARITSLISSALCFKQAAATRRGGSPVWIMSLDVPDRIPGDL